MEKEATYFYHWIPKISELGIIKDKQEEAPKKEPWMIAIIDSSGSMKSCWKHVAKNYNQLIEGMSSDKVFTFCFSHDIYDEPSNRLTYSIKDYGGGMTDIYLAMEELEFKLKKIPKGEEVNVIFVSDGNDTCNDDKIEAMLDSLKGANDWKISFMCVGVKSGFPTFLSLSLREKYHRGDSTIPSIFLIEYTSDKAFFNKF